MMEYLNAGDRIVTAVHVDGEDDVSGIVGWASSLGGGEYMTLLYVGGEQVDGKVMPTYASEIVNILCVDVVEAGCSYPPIPSMIRRAFDRALKQAMIEVRAKYPERERAVAACKNHIPERWQKIPPVEIDKMRGGNRDAIGRELLTMAVKQVRELPGPTNEYKLAFFAACLERNEEFVSVLGSAPTGS